MNPPKKGKANLLAVAKFRYSLSTSLKIPHSLSLDVHPLQKVGQFISETFSNPPVQACDMACECELCRIRTTVGQLSSRRERISSLQQRVRLRTRTADVLGTNV